MKAKIFKISFIFLLLVTMGAGCEKEDSSSTVCGIKDPLTNLNWLRDLKVNLEGDSDVNLAEIVLYQLDNVDYIYVLKSISSSYDIPNTIYNCKGDEKYQCGGNQPVDSCTTFFLEAHKIKTLWQKK